MVQTANGAFTVTANDSVKRTCVEIFRRVIASDFSKPQKAEVFESYMPKIVTVLNSTQDLGLLCECLHALQQCSDVFPLILLSKHSLEVIKACSQLKSFRKRIVRKFARGVINAWSMLE